MACTGTVHLRRAATTDARGIVEVHARGWQVAHEALVPGEYLACVSARFREAFWLDALRMSADDRKPWVALIDDRIVGFASGGLSRDPDAGSDVGEVYLAYVDPTCWGRGIGGTLLSHVTRDLEKHGFEAATYWVLAENASARRFAERQGWHVDGATRVEDCGGTQVPQVRYRRMLGHRAPQTARPAVLVADR